VVSNANLTDRPLKIAWPKRSTHPETRMRISRPTVGQIWKSGHVGRGNMTSSTTFSCVARRDSAYISLSHRLSPKAGPTRTPTYLSPCWSHDLDLADKYAPDDVINKPTTSPVLVSYSVGSQHKQQADVPQVKSRPSCSSAVVM
jgi:hypothetical protein